MLSNGNKDWFDAQTVRVVKKGRNQYAISGDFELKVNFGNEINVFDNNFFLITII